MNPRRSLEEFTPRACVEHRIVYSLIAPSAWLKHAAEHLAEYTELAPADRDLLTSAAEAVRPQMQHGRALEVDPASLHFLCFVGARWRRNESWRDLLRDAPEARRELAIVAGGGGLEGLGAYLDAPAIQLDLLDRHLTRLGIPLPAHADIASVVPVLEQIRRVGFSLTDVPEWRTYSQLTGEDVDTIVDLLLGVQLHRYAEFMPMDIIARIAVTGPGRLTHHLDRLLTGYSHVPEVAGMTASPATRDRLLGGELPRAHMLLPWIRD